MSKQECVSMARDYNHHAIACRRIGEGQKALDCIFRRDRLIAKARAK